MCTYVIQVELVADYYASNVISQVKIKMHNPASAVKALAAPVEIEAPPAWSPQVFPSYNYQVGPVSDLPDVAALQATIAALEAKLNAPPGVNDRQPVAQQIPEYNAASQQAPEYDQSVVPENGAQQKEFWFSSTHLISWKSWMQVEVDEFSCGVCMVVVVDGVWKRVR